MSADKNGNRWGLHGNGVGRGYSWNRREEGIGWRTSRGSGRIADRERRRGRHRLQRQPHTRFCFRRRKRRQMRGRGEDAERALQALLDGRLEAFCERAGAEEEGVGPDCELR